MGDFNLMSPPRAENEKKNERFQSQHVIWLNSSNKNHIVEFFIFQSISLAENLHFKATTIRQREKELTKNGGL